MLQQLQTAKKGLTAGEARERLARYGSNLPKPAQRPEVDTLLFAHFKSPLILILFFATGLSFFLHEPVDAFIILAIVLRRSRDRRIMAGSTWPESRWTEI